MRTYGTYASPSYVNTYNSSGNRNRSIARQLAIGIWKTDDRAEKRKRIPQKLSNVTREMLGRCIAEAL